MSRTYRSREAQTCKKRALNITKDRSNLNKYMAKKVPIFKANTSKTALILNLALSVVTFLGIYF